jgi:hypothetical protein
MQKWWWNYGCQWSKVYGRLHTGSESTIHKGKFVLLFNTFLAKPVTWELKSNVWQCWSLRQNDLVYMQQVGSKQDEKVILLYVKKYLYRYN